jgi:NADH-quinone oxidoreductase subunit L
MVTAFYMFRLYFLTFHGKFRGTEEQHHHLHESPGSMTIPLVILAILAVVGGTIGIPGSHLLNHFLNPGSHQHNVDWGHELPLMGIAVALAGVSIWFAWSVFVKRNTIPTGREEDLSKLQRIIYNKYYIDEFYDVAIRKPLDWLSGITYRFVELPIIDGFVNGIGSSIKWLGSAMRLLQSGYTGFYIFAMVIAIIALLFVKFY